MMTRGGGVMLLVAAVVLASLGGLAEAHLGHASALPALRRPTTLAWGGATTNVTKWQASVPDWAKPSVVLGEEKKNKGPRIEWTGVTVKVSSSRTVLSAIHGSAAPGRLHAIMGPSGSGKSTLLNAVAGRVKASKGISLAGDVLIDGASEESSFFSPAGALRTRNAYVKQADSFYPFLTVRETLMFAARLRLPRSVSRQDKERTVDDLLKKMGLAKAADTIVGDEKVRGISGGERKRLSIACELIDEPAVLFLDEPTSGLDSFAAERVVLSLKALADEGKTVICVIHQPSAKCFGLFDDLTLVSEGALVYQGPIAKLDAKLSALGHARPRAASLPEHAVQTVSVDYESKKDESRSRAVIAKFIADAAHEANKASPYTTTSSKEPVPVEKSKRATIGEQYRLLFSRAWRDVTRAKTATIIKATQQIMTALIYGSIYDLDDSQRSIQDRFGLLSLCVIGSSNLAVATTIRAFPKEKAIILEERASKMYGAFPYMLSKVLAELPVAIGLSSLFGIIVYPLAKLRKGLRKFATFLGVTALNSVASSALGLLVGAAAPSTDTALALFPPIIVLMIIFNGANISDESTPRALRWLPKLSLVRWGFEALAVNEFQGLRFKPFNTRGPPRGALTGEDALARLQFTDSTVKRAVSWQAAIAAVAYAQTYNILRQSKPNFAKFPSPKTTATTGLSN